MYFASMPTSPNIVFDRLFKIFFPKNTQTNKYKIQSYIYTRRNPNINRRNPNINIDVSNE